MDVIPFSWPVGMGRQFKGVFDIQRDRMRVFRAGQERRGNEDELIDGLENPVIRERFGDPFEKAHEEIVLIKEASADFDHDAFLADQQTPLFFGSAINNFGVQEVLDALVNMAPPPGPRVALEREVQPDEKKFTGVVFKVQANMDPAHRDRVAFVRISSGTFERGMRLRVSRTGRDIRTNNVVSFLSQRRDLLDKAYAGDIIGIPNHGLLQLGDVLTEGETLHFTGLPFFAPELFRGVEVKDPLRTKQLRTGLTQLGEEGAIQVFRPVAAGGTLLLGAVGQLQFEVVAHRLKTEYAVDARMMPSRYNMARWFTAEDPKILRKFMNANAANIAYDVVDAAAFLASSPAQLRVAQELYPGIEFHAMREHGGQVFGQNT